MTDCRHPATRMVELTITATCATAGHACVVCGVRQWSESHNLTLWRDEKRGELLAKLRAEFEQQTPMQVELFT